MQYVDLIIDNKSRYTDNLFTYASREILEPGTVCHVSFGNGKSLKTAYVFHTDVELRDGLSPEKIKEIADVDPDISMTPEMVRTSEWMRMRYGIKYIDAIKCFVPNGKPAKEGKEKEPYKGSEGEAQDIDELTAEQKSAVEKIYESMDRGLHDIFLIHGVTGSGKTEVYMRAIAHALEQGKTAIMLVPEIALTKQIIERFIGRFGKKEIAVLHSKLTKRERFDEWMRLRRGEARIAIGARIGVFSPLENVGVIILDEEHESTYKSDQTPKYETVDVAAKRLMDMGGVLLLGSATPSAVSYERALAGIYKLIELKNRYNDNPLPDVEIVDMRQELRSGNRGILSIRLKEEMAAALAQGKQIILFLNRRGYSTFVSCRDCGAVLKCPECGISLVYHKTENAMVCHYCGKKQRVPSTCPACGSGRIKYFGVGTEQVEETVKELFPGVETLRLDIDTAKNGKEIDRILNAFAKKKADVLIGTQLVAKGLDFRNVALVGAVSADVSLNIPDYRSTERTFQLITQVAGRAGRGDEQGKVIVQTYSPDNFALTAAAEHDYGAFYRNEIMARQLMDYPPFTDLIAAGFTSEDEDAARSAAEECRDYLVRAGLPNAGKTLLPRVAQNFKGESASRYHIMVKSPRGERNKYVYYLTYFAERLKGRDPAVSMTLDINPYSTF